MWNAPTVQSRQPLTYRLMESVGLGGPRWLGSSWQRGITEGGSSLLSTLMMETPGDLIWDLPCQLPGRGPLLWIWPLYLHVNFLDAWSVQLWGIFLVLDQCDSVVFSWRLISATLWYFLDAWSVRLCGIFLTLNQCDSVVFSWLLISTTLWYFLGAWSVRLCGIFLTLDQCDSVVFYWRLISTTL